MFQQDYILRQIEMMGKVIAKILGRDTTSEIFDDIIRDDGVVCEDQYIRYTVMNLLADGRINEAEDILFDAVENHPHKEYFSVALEFYGELANMSEQKLKEHNFTYQEVLDGLTAIKKLLPAAEGDSI